MIDPILLTPMEPANPMNGPAPMTQPGLFDRPRFTLGACAFGPGDETWLGPHHCPACAAEVAAAVATMTEARQRGEFDAQGFTSAEARAARRVA